MELRQLRYMIAVSEAATFVKAAERLNLAQPALSRQIQVLEKELGAPLFVRGRRAVTLTPAGVVCLGKARSIVRRMREAVARAGMANVGRVGPFSLYASQWATWSGFAAKLVAYLNWMEPDIVLSLEEAGPGGHWGGLRSGKAELAIATKPPPEFTDLESSPLLEDVVNTAVLSMDHRLAGRDSIRLDDLKDEPFLIYDDSTVNYRDHDLDDALDKAGVTPTNRRVVSSPEALMAMVASGMGWSIHRRLLHGKIPNVATVPIEGFALPFPVTLVKHKGDNRPIVKTVERRIREIAQIEYRDSYIAAPDDHDRDVSWPSSSVPGNVELRDLRYYATTVESESIGRAAKKLDMTQPALSRQMQILERDLGVRLLDRTGRGVTATPAGRAFLGDAIAILEECDSVSVDVARGERAVAGRCVLASLPSSEVREITGRVVRTVATEYPHIDLHIENIPTPRQPAAVQAGTVDIGMCHPFPGLVAGFPDVDCHELLSDTIDSALLATNHPLAARKELALTDLADVPFLFFRRDFHPAFHDYLMDVFRNQGYRPIEGPMQEGLQTMWSLTAAAEGWSLGFGGQRNDPPPGIVAVPLKNVSIPWGVVMLTRRDESRANILAAISVILRG